MDTSTHRPLVVAAETPGSTSTSPQTPHHEVEFAKSEILWIANAVARGKCDWRPYFLVQPSSEIPIATEPRPFFPRTKTRNWGLRDIRSGSW